MFCRIVLSATVAVRDKRQCTIGCHTRPPPSLPQSANLFSLRWSLGLEISRTFSPPGCVGLCVCVCFICSQFNLISCSYAKYLDVLFHSNPFSSAGRHSLVKNGPANSLKSKSRPFRFTSNQAIFNVHRPVWSNQASKIPNPGGPKPHFSPGFLPVLYDCNHLEAKVFLNNSGYYSELYRIICMYAVNSMNLEEWGGSSGSSINQTSALHYYFNVIHSLIGDLRTSCGDGDGD